MSVRLASTGMLAAATSAAASRRKPPRNTDSFLNTSCSLGVRRLQEWSNTARKLRCRSLTFRKGLSRKSRLPSISRVISATGISFTQAAASSMPSGIPSISSQMRSTSGMTSLVSEKRKSALLARYQNSSVASRYWTSIWGAS